MKAQVQNHETHFWSNYGLLGLTIAAFLTFFALNLNNLLRSSYNDYPFAIQKARPFSTVPVFNNPTPNTNAIAITKPEAEPSLEVEEWMSATENWGQAVEAEVSAEPWMSNVNLWSIADEADPCLEVEDWMSNPNAWELSEETVLAIEPWMSDLDQWGKTSLDARADTLAVSKKLNN